MRDDLLSIGEAARLKGISVKALRYYDRIGILPPAALDPKSGYRYYAPAQMFDLDVIITCLELGIPLKSLRHWQADDGSLDLQGLLSAGRDLACTRLRRAQDSLIQIDACLQEMADQERLRTLEAPYRRTLPAWLACTTPWELTGFSTKAYLKTMTDLYHAVDAAGATPLYFQGLLIDTESDEPSQAAYVQVAQLPTEEMGAALEIQELPERAYEGFRIEDESLSACLETVFARVEERPGRYVATEVWDGELPARSFVVELLRAC